jgi:hypothetical protein
VCVRVCVRERESVCVCVCVCRAADKGYHNGEGCTTHQTVDWHALPWTGYSWDRHLFPFNEDALAYLKYRGLFVAANLHDSDGVAWYEDTYANMATAVGINPATKQTVPFFAVNSTYMYALEDAVLQPREQDGMDFWWYVPCSTMFRSTPIMCSPCLCLFACRIDWQQGGTQGGCTGEKLNPTILTNKVRVSDPIRRGHNARGMVLARFGGLGNHRYQVRV